MTITPAQNVVATNRAPLSDCDENGLLADLRCLVRYTRDGRYVPRQVSRDDAEMAIWKAIRTLCADDEEFCGVHAVTERLMLYSTQKDRREMLIKTGLRIKQRILGEGLVKRQKKSTVCATFTV